MPWNNFEEALRVATLPWTGWGCWGGSTVRRCYSLRLPQPSAAGRPPSLALQLIFWIVNCEKYTTRHDEDKNQRTSAWAMEIKSYVRVYRKERTKPLISPLIPSIKGTRSKERKENWGKFKVFRGYFIPVSPCNGRVQSIVRFANCETNILGSGMQESCSLQKPSGCLQAKTSCGITTEIRGTVFALTNCHEWLDRWELLQRPSRVLRLYEL